jgi:hypothetical protein
MVVGLGPGCLASGSDLEIPFSCKQAIYVNIRISVWFCNEVMRHVLSAGNVSFHLTKLPLLSTVST